MPIRSSVDTGTKLPLWFWNVSGRLQWLLNIGRQPETRHQTNERAERFVAEITSYDEDCAIVTHGFFMHMLVSVMKRHGFKADKTAFHYHNGETIVIKKQAID